VTKEPGRSPALLDGRGIRRVLLRAADPAPKRPAKVSGNRSIPLRHDARSILFAFLSDRYY